MTWRGRIRFLRSMAPGYFKPFNPTNVPPFRSHSARISVQNRWPLAWRVSTAESIRLASRHRVVQWLCPLWGWAGPSRRQRRSADRALPRSWRRPGLGPRSAARRGGQRPTRRAPAWRLCRWPLRYGGGAASSRVEPHRAALAIAVGNARAPAGYQRPERLRTRCRACLNPAIR